MMAEWHFGVNYPFKWHFTYIGPSTPNILLDISITLSFSLCNCLFLLSELRLNSGSLPLALGLVWCAKHVAGTIKLSPYQWETVSHNYAKPKKHKQPHIADRGVNRIYNTVYQMGRDTHWKRNGEKEREREKESDISPHFSSNKRVHQERIVLSKL